MKTAHKRREPIDLTQGPCWKVILLFSLPVILSYLLQQVYSISDAAIVGQTLTAAEVAGVNDTNSLVFIFLQFAFGGGDNEYLPHNHVKNSVVYPGTHDNTTLTDWWVNSATAKEKATAAAYLHLTPCKPTAKEVAAVKPDDARIALIRAALGSVADRVIIPMSDWLGLGAQAHLNTPGKLGGNWAWRAAAGFESKTLAKTIADECSVYCRV